MVVADVTGVLRSSMLMDVGVYISVSLRAGNKYPSTNYIPVIVLPLNVVMDVTSVTLGLVEDDCASAEELFQSSRYAARRALEIFEALLVIFARRTRKCA